MRMTIWHRFNERSLQSRKFSKLNFSKSSILRCSGQWVTGLMPKFYLRFKRQRKGLKLKHRRISLKWQWIRKVKSKSPSSMTSNYRVISRRKSNSSWPKIKSKTYLEKQKEIVGLVYLNRIYTNAVQKINRVKKRISQKMLMMKFTMMKCGFTKKMSRFPMR